MEFGVFIHISASENSMYVYCIQLFFMQGVWLRSIRITRTINGVFITKSLGVFVCNVCVSTHGVGFMSRVYT